MTMITLEEMDEKIEQEKILLTDIRALIANLRAEIQDYQEYLAMRGDCEEVKPCPDVKRIGALYHNCIDTENRLGECKARKLGIAQNGVAFNLDEAKAEIGRKLDRLRAAACAEDVS